MRLDPKLKYLAEIASRIQRRSLANFVEWAIETGLKYTAVDPDSKHPISAWEKGRALWNVEPADRLANLAFGAPDLMTYDEQVLWNLICDTGYVWRATVGKEPGGKDLDWRWEVKPDSLRRDRLRECWSAFQKVAAGEADPRTLPSSAPVPRGRQQMARVRGDHN